MVNTFAEIDNFVNEFEYKPTTSIEQGIDNFVSWFKKYNNE